ncbi:hypothetical protein GX51_07622 [Blastomyces parvus]|uniref:Uncharacterized protein n=1 Tax=Blastomyces parvus TaxID=2060905 RepID=A0A2B7WJF4_9EURO|nr:hypothetical protein GX51_07622 [Blastomyces parvus]
MKLATLFRSTYFIVTAIATPFTQSEHVDVDVNVPNQSLNSANVNLQQIMFAPPYNWKPKLQLFEAVEMTYDYPSARPSVEFSYFLKLECNRISSCKSIAGVRQNNDWIGWIFNISINREDFIRDYRYSDSFAFTT